MWGEDVTQATTPVEDWIQGIYGLFDSAGHLITFLVQLRYVLGAEVVAGGAYVLPKHQRHKNYYHIASRFVIHPTNGKNVASR
jgi:hypothetical protein